ncbi:MAG: flagellar hook-length control protein FliK [Ignavibacterium sp.]|nr:flagellar hook-length control protein FliK [Ignavibacterium sp.]
MFINSLFLSKLLNPKTESQPTNEVGEGFNYLFSEIIKVKTSDSDSIFISENIGGTLLDHKTIFIANSSPLDKVKVSKAANEINHIEKLYKLFLEPGNQSETGTEQINLSLNKILSDKTQFVKSIESLIKNILSSNSDKQVNNVEIKYVSQNLIETVRLNEKNLSQFTEYLSGLIDNNSSFSFIIGANGKQILFDVENVSLDTKGFKSLTLSSEPTQNQENIANISSKSDESFQSVETLTDESSEKIPAMNVENSSEKNIRAEAAQKKFVRTEENFIVKPNTISDDSLHYEPKNVIDVKPSNEKAETKLPPVIPNYKETTHKSSEENKIDLKLPDSSVKTITTSKYEMKNNSTVIFEFDEELINEKTFSNKNSLELNELKDKNLGEVKIVIKSKPNEYHFQQDIKPDVRSADKVKIETAPVSQRLNESNSNRVSLTDQSLKNIPSLKNTMNDNFEKDLPEISAASVNEPRISRAGLPLIADYQDWDLVFERAEKSLIKQVQVQTNFSAEKRDVIRQKIDEKDRNIGVEIKKSDSTKTSDKQNEPVKESRNSQKEFSNLTQKSDDSIRINDAEVKSGINEKVMNLKLSGEKKIVSISNSIPDDSKNIIEVKENYNDNNKVNLKYEFTQRDKSFVQVSKQNSFTDDNLENEKSALRQDAKAESSSTKNDSFEHSSESNLKKANDHFQQVNDKTKIDNSTGKDNEFRNEFQNVSRQEFVPSGKTNLINNKNIIEHFIKNPIESKTLEKFIQILDKQEVVQRSEIVSYSKLNHSVEIKLAPEELGKIKIFLDTNDNNVNAKIEVNSEQTKVIVVNNLPQLKETLTQQGVNLNNVNVTVTSEEHKGSEQTKQKSKKKSQESNSKIENADDKRTVRNLGYNTYEYLA